MIGIGCKTDINLMFTRGHYDRLDSMIRFVNFLYQFTVQIYFPARWIKNFRNNKQRFLVRKDMKAAFIRIQRIYYHPAGIGFLEAILW